MKKMIIKKVKNGNFFLFVVRKEGKEDTID